MDSANISEEEMKYLIDKYSGENVNQLFSTGLLTHPYESSGPRLHMFSVHYAQHIMLKNAETPRTFTGWENQFGKYLNSFYKSDKSWEIVAKIVRHQSFPEISYLLVVREMGTNNYDVIKVSHYEKLSDQHGYLRPFSYMDDKIPGNIIRPNEFVYKANSLDEFGNYRYGRNYKVAYLLIPEVKDDAIVMSESAAKNTTFDLITKTELVINKNDILLNIYGDLKNYKSFPFVGEDVSDKGILFATRKMDKKNLSADFTDMALMNIYYTDNKFGAHGKVIDIDIKVNDVEELKKDLHRQELFEIYNDQYRYNQEVVDVLQAIVNDKNNRTTDKLDNTLFNARNYISPNIKYSGNSNFEFAHITIYTCDTQSLSQAMKTTNRCGGKAVVSNIWPDEMMPVDEYGRRADVIASANGIIGRANIEQMFEQHINFTSDMIEEKMKKAPTAEKAIEIQNNYFKYISPKWGEYNEEIDKTRSHKEREEYLENLYKSKNGLYVYDPPAYGAIGWDIIKTLGKKFKIKPSKVKMCKKYNVSPEIAALYDSKETINFVKDFMENYTFDSSTNVIKKKEGKKSVLATKTEFNEYTYEDAVEQKKNPLKLSSADYKNNTWTDDYVWSDSEIGLEDIDNASSDESDLVKYINTIQELEGEFDKDDLLLNQVKSTFDTTKSKVYRIDDHTIVREFVSKYPVVIGDVYLMILKQLPFAAFSVRSLGSMTPLGLPNKSAKKVEVGRPYGDTANQFSEMDNMDLKNLVDPKKVSRFLAVQSTDPQMRSECAEMLLFADPTRLHDLPYSDDEIDCDTVPARQLVSYLSAIGLEIGDADKEDPYSFLDDVQYKNIPDLMKKVGIDEKNNPFVNIKVK